MLERFSGHLLLRNFAKRSHIMVHDAVEPAAFLLHILKSSLKYD